MLLNDHNSPAVLMGRCGFTAPKDGFASSKRLADIFVAKARARGIFIEYDMSYPGRPENLTYTEMFVNLGGLYVRPCDNAFTLNMVDSLKERGCIGLSYRNLIADHVGDKYSNQMLPLYHSDTVVILPGSNIIKTIAQQDLIDIALRHPGAVFKPHPLILAQDYAQLTGFLEGTGAYVMAPQFSGMYLVERSQNVYTLKCSEVGLTAGILEKKVHIIPSREHTGPYYAFYHALFRGYLWDMIEFPESGLFLDVPGVEDRMEEYLDAYQRFYHDYRTGSPSARSSLRS